jgi:Na+/melibiose symporter-like transporter
MDEDKAAFGCNNTVTEHVFTSRVYNPDDYQVSEGSFATTTVHLSFALSIAISNLPRMQTIKDEKTSPEHVGPETSSADASTSRNYSAFSKWRKRWIVFIAAFAAWFSTLSSFIFFPAIILLARGLDTSIQNINLTVTSYLLVAGVAPAVTATLADKIGRRPAFLASFIVFLVANIGLALQRSFAALFVLRMLQASGVAGTFAIAYGVVADIATPAERGSYVGVVAFW